ncbi:hypothetical protein TNCV_3639101 [Trichonephila clavipes]|nr:hypothetical protein TNCV_3639101 [Trichonephila clavipes]
MIAARSPGSQSHIEHVWDFLGRRLAARTLPPVTIRELRLALQDEWAAMPQQLFDTLILSMGRRYHLNETLGSKRGYYLSSGLVLLGTLCLFLIDIHRYQVQKKKQPDIQQKTEILFGQPIRRRESSHETLFEEATPKGFGDLRKAQELTCISEEILVENFLEDYIDDCITSCNKEEKFLMLSEFENNLFKTDESLERERESSSQDDSDNMPNIPHHYCNICTRGHRHTEQPIYSPRKMMRTISNIDIIDEATSSL